MTCFTTAVIAQHVNNLLCGIAGTLMLDFVHIMDVRCFPESVLEYSSSAAGTLGASLAHV